MRAGPSGTPTTMGHLDGKVALVTGGGSGIGAAISERFARDGAAVAVNGLGEDGIAEVVGRIEAAGGRAVGVPGDVSDPEVVERLVTRCVEDLGGLHVAVNNAGVQQEQPTLQTPLEDWRWQLAVNLDGPFLVSQAAGRHMAAHGGGVILNNSSVHEVQPRPRFAAYCASKAALGMLTKVMAMELAASGIRVVAVAPGAIDTAMQDELDETERQQQLDGIPAGRLGQPQEVAALFSFLAGAEAGYVSGTTVVVDGALLQQFCIP
jgi:glucose 1-dehydrogenase